jgi:hypothetical protein
VGRRGHQKAHVHRTMHLGRQGNQSFWSIKDNQDAQVTQGF